MRPFLLLCAFSQAVWDVKWSEDDPSLVAVMKKREMVVFHDYRSLSSKAGDHPQDKPLQTSAFPVAFTGLRMTSVFVNDLMTNPSSPALDLVSHYRVGALR